MTTHGQRITHAVYEDPEVVQGYINRNAVDIKTAELIQAFAKTISGKCVLDLGCGPGHESYFFHQLGFQVTGLDYSREMITRAKTLRAVQNPPTFLVGDMRKLSDYFPKASFDGVWVNASLLHIPKADVHAVLSGITDVARKGASVGIRLKAGEGTRLTDDDKYGKAIQREFTFWTKESFLAEVVPFGWELAHFSTQSGSRSQWITFFFTLPADSPR